jgi:molybdate transport system substrate-binding protein
VVLFSATQNPETGCKREAARAYIGCLRRGGYRVVASRARTVVGNTHRRVHPEHPRSAVRATADGMLVENSSASLQKAARWEDIMKIGTISVAAEIAFILLLGQVIPAKAAEIRVLSAAAMAAALGELGGQFERTTTHTLVVGYDVVGVLRRQIAAGEKFDVAILTPPVMNELIKEGKIIPNTVATIARSGMGVIMHKGAPRPDIGSADAFKRAMLNAQSIAYTKGTPSAAYLVKLFERLGIAEQMKPKTKLSEGTGATEQAVSDGEAELGFMTLSIFLHMPGVELVGPLPPELQNYAVYVGGVGTSAKEPEASKALIHFLTSASAASVLRARGMDPGAPK